MSRSRRLLVNQRLRRPFSSPTVVTIGVFDGVHLAHQRLIRTAIRLARRLHARSLAMTFDPDPQRVLDPLHAPPALMPLGERISALRALGVDRVWVRPFTKRFARTSAERFVRRVLQRQARALAVVVGADFVFGQGRRGDMALLRALGPSCGIRVAAVPQVVREGAPVSSSRIRRLIADGKLSLARRLLGRPPALYGVVVRGARRGHRLGFPTANLALTPQVVPPRGVYAVAVHLRRTHRVWPGVMNVGHRPTFGGGPLVCEVHLLGFSGTLLRRAVRLSLLARLRGERCFPTPEALRRQILRDIHRARRLFAREAALFRS